MNMMDMLLWCPRCGARHLDEGEFEHKPHHTHACQQCGTAWRPAVEPTRGVLFLPGFKSPEVGVLEYDDPFERVLSYAAVEWGITARVRFVHARQLASWRPIISWFKQPKGETLFRDEGSPLISVNAALRRGVAGTLDILAHELAHVRAGLEAEHGLPWKAAYDELYRAAIAEPTVLRVIR